MVPYFQTCKLASWLLLVVTLALASLIIFAAIFVYGFVGYIQHLMVPEKPWLIRPALWFGTSVMLPAVFLAGFYFSAGMRARSACYTRIGWTASAFYHAALTWFFVFYMPGWVQTPGGLSHLPLWSISGAAFCTSIYLVIRYPSPPRLPTVHLRPTNAA